MENAFNILGIIIAPIIAVLVGRWLQDRADKRNDKMSVFKAAMTYRYSLTPEAVHALNSIPIVYAKEEEVRKCWRALYEDLCIQNANELQIKKRNDDLYKLLESMAKVLGYKDSITWQDIQNPYVPVGITNAINNNAILQGEMVALLQQMKDTGASKEQKSN